MRRGGTVLNAHSAQSVSVVIPHYGDPAPTLALIETLTPQCSQVVVSDDRSPIPFPDTEGVTVVRRSENGGFGRACNSGAAAATGELLLFLNSDADVGPTFVPDLVAAAAPWQPCVAGPATSNGTTLETTARFFPGITEHIVEWLVPLARFHGRPWMERLMKHDASALRATDPHPTDWVVGAAMLIPRVSFESVGGFDENFYMNSEEVDLQRRLADIGVPAIYIPTVRMIHVGGGSSDSAKRIKWVTDSRMLYSTKWGGRRRLRAGLTAATIVNLAWNLGRRLLRHKQVRPIEEAKNQWEAIWAPPLRPTPLAPENV